MAPCLAFAVVYVWSRRSPTARISFLGLFTFTAPYLPWIILGFGVLLGQSAQHDLLGLAAGHIYYFLEDVYPTITQRKILRTPQLIKTFFDDQVDDTINNNNTQDGLRNLPPRPPGAAAAAAAAGQDQQPVQ